MTVGLSGSPGVMVVCPGGEATSPSVEIGERTRKKDLINECESLLSKE